MNVKLFLLITSADRLMAYLLHQTAYNRSMNFMKPVPEIALLRTIRENGIQY